jgi:tagatose 6-phosphate kinase
MTSKELIVVGLHPSCDYFHDRRNGTEKVHKKRGGNGLIVARTATRLGQRRHNSVGVRLLTVIGEDDLEFFTPGLAGFHCEPIVLPGKTRKNHTYLHPGGRPETFRRGRSTFVVGPEAENILVNQLSSVPAGRWVVVTGSLPPGLTRDFYVTVIRMLQRQGAFVLFDGRAEDVAYVLSMGVRPDALKANRQEISRLLRRKNLSRHEMANLAAKLLPGKLVVISLGEEGVLACLPNGQTWHLPAEIPPGMEFKTSVGCGDSGVGYLGCGLAEGMDLLYALQLFVGASVSNVFNFLPGDFLPELAENIAAQVVPTRLDFSNHHPLDHSNHDRRVPA